MTSVVVRKGNIVNADANAIANAGNTSLWLGTGVAGAIKSACGPELQAELDRIRKLRNASRNAVFPSDLGEVIITHAGKLVRRRPNPIQFVLHAAVMHSQGPDRGKTDADIIYEATKNCVLASRMLGIHTLALPLFGTGVGGMDLEHSAGIISRALRDYPMPDLFVKIFGFTQADVDVVTPVVKSFF